MLFIVILILFSFFCISQFSKQNQVHQSQFVVVMILCLFFISAFRYKMGDDWEIYSHWFTIAPPIFEIESDFIYSSGFLEPGYKIFNSLLKTVTNNSQMIFVASQIIVSSLFVKSLFRYSRFPLMACFVYFGVLFLSLDLLFLRQTISVQLLLLGLKYVKDKKWWKYLSIITIAVLFHYSAVILYPLYFVLRRKISDFFILSVTAIGFVLFVFHIDVTSVFFNMFNVSKLHEYMSHSEYGLSRSFGFMHVEILVLLCLILWLRKQNTQAKSEYENIFINLFFLYVIIVLYTFPLSSFAGRVKFYFIISYIYIIPELIGCFQKYSNKIVAYLILTVYLLLYQTNLIFSEKGHIYTNYKNYIVEKICDNI